MFKTVAKAKALHTRRGEEWTCLPYCYVIADYPVQVVSFDISAHFILFRFLQNADIGK